MRVLAILHPGGGHSGVLGERVLAGGHELVQWTPGDGEAIPDPLEDHDALAVFGGGMNVREAERLPWMRGEIELLRDALAADMPVIGVCLGAQLLAAATGADVRRAREPEIGWHEAWLLPAAAEDPVVGNMPERFTAYQWHSYVSETPVGAIELACSAVCPQAYRLGDRAWGVQFHPEVTPGIVRGWTEDFESDPDAVALGVDPPVALAEAERRLPAWMAIGAALFDGFLEVAATASAAHVAAADPAALAPPLPRG